MLTSNGGGAHTLQKDTVTAHEEDDKVNANHHVGEYRPSVRHNAVVHHGVPVLSGENLHRRTIKESQTWNYSVTGGGKPRREILRSPGSK